MSATVVNAAEADLGHDCPEKQWSDSAISQLTILLMRVFR